MRGYNDLKVVSVLEVLLEAVPVLSTGLTDSGEDAGEAEVVNSIEGELVEQELFFLLFTAQEGVALV